MLLKKLAALGVVVTLVGCSSRIVKESVYWDGERTYKVRDNKAVNGTVIKDMGSGYTEYFTYKRGKLINYKKVDRQERLVEEENYNKMGYIVSKKEYDEGGEFLRKISYDEYGREIEPEKL